MQYQELCNRLAGIHPNLWMTAWEAPLVEQSDIAKAVIAHLTEQTVLYSLSEIEAPSECISSIMQTRQFLAEQLDRLDPDSGLAASLRGMRSACQKFLDRAFDRKEIERYGTKRSHWASWILISSLGELRGVFGMHLATIAAQHRLDIEGPLEYILPLADDATVTIKV